MKKRALGSTGLEIAPLVLGGNVFGWTIDQARSFEVLDAFVDAGLNGIDTADAYSVWVPGNQGGESEAIIGNWIKERGQRDKVVIATKVGWEVSPEKKGLRRDYIIRSAEESLRRLQTDYIDLYQSHKDDPSTPLEETLEAYDRLLQDGKIRAIGASNYSADRLREALTVSQQHNLPIYKTMQPEYNLYDRAGYEQELEPLCLEQGLGVISYFSLASGFLTGKYRSEEDLNKSQRGGGIKQYLNERGFRILQALDEVAEQYQATPAQISLAWLMARPSVTAPISSATSVEQLQDLVKATQLELDQAALDKLTQASAA